MRNSASVSCFSPTQASGMWGALCTLHLYPVSVSCIWVAIRTLYPVSRIRIPYLVLIPYPVSRIPSSYPVFGAHSVPCLMFPVSFVLFLGCALYFASCGLGRIPYPVSRIRIPYRGGLNIWGRQGFLLKHRQISHRQISIQLGRFLGNFSPDFSEISPLRTLCSKCAAIRIRLMSKKAGT